MPIAFLFGAIYQLHYAPMRLHTSPSLLFFAASDKRLGRGCRNVAGSVLLCATVVLSTRQIHVIMWIAFSVMRRWLHLQLVYIHSETALPLQSARHVAISQVHYRSCLVREMEYLNPLVTYLITRSDPHVTSPALSLSSHTVTSQGGGAKSPYHITSSLFV